MRALLLYTTNDRNTNTLLHVHRNRVQDAVHALAVAVGDLGAQLQHAVLAGQGDGGLDRVLHVAPDRRLHVDDAQGHSAPAVARQLDLEAVALGLFVRRSEAIEEEALDGVAIQVVFGDVSELCLAHLFREQRIRGREVEWVGARPLSLLSVTDINKEADDPENGRHH